jgi:uncharacterized protein
MLPAPVLATARTKRVAVVGGGVSGLGCAWLLARGGHTVTLYESATSLGGHARTVSVPVPGAGAAPVDIDVGFIVYNTATYPDLVSLFEVLRVPQDNSVMSFAASVDVRGDAVSGTVEWGSDSLSSLFADSENLTRPAIYTMLWDMRRFNAAVHAYVDHVDRFPESPESSQTLADFLAAGAYSQTFIQCYLIPMVSSVWSATFRGALSFPARALFRFFVNHGLAQTFNRPQWRTPLRRSRDYVDAVAADLRCHGAVIRTGTAVTSVSRSGSSSQVFVDGDSETPAEFDHVVFATHAPVTLKILGAAASAAERRILGAFQYGPNKGYVHTDASLMPAARGTWSAWNFISRRGDDAEQIARDRVDPASGALVPSEDAPACVTYWLNKLQNLNRPVQHRNMPDVFLTLNPCTPIDPSKIISEEMYNHPQFTDESVSAQEELQNVIQGENQTWFCGAYARYGFHEDGLMTGLDVAERLSGYKVLRPWRSKPCLSINNNYRHYTAPFTSPKSLSIVYLGGLAVINAVGSRIHQGLLQLSSRLTQSDPAVVLSTGNGTLLRFGQVSSSSSSSTVAAAKSLPLAPSCPQKRVDQDANCDSDVVMENPGLINVRSPRLLARVTDAIRHHRDLAPVAAAAFVTGEVDCPLPSDLSTMLRALMVSQRKGPELGHGLQGQMHLAGTLLHAIVGGFEAATPPRSVSRLPELTTAIHSVVYPCWWPAATVDDVRAGTSGSGHNILELVGDLSENTVTRLRTDHSSRATIVVAFEERVPYVQSKAKLAHVFDQVKIVVLADFLSSARLAASPSSPSSRGTFAKFDRILSPAIVNLCEGSFVSLSELMTFIYSILVTDGGMVELGFAASDEPRIHGKVQMQNADEMYSGDSEFRMWPTRAVVDAADTAGLRLCDLSHMASVEAACNVQMTIDRVFAHLAAEKLSKNEIRQTLGQFCLWHAALMCGVASRAVVILERLRSDN